MRNWGLAVAMLVLLTGCGGNKDAANPPSSQPPPSVQSTPTPQPPTGVHVSRQQLLTADPCGLLDPKPLAKFGAVKIEQDQSYVSCSLSIDGPGDADVNGSVEFDVGLTGTSPGEPPQKANRLNGVLVYSQATDQDLCIRDAVPYPNLVISIYASYSTPPTTKPCDVSDAVTQSVLRKLASGTIKAASHGAGSLANIDACTLLKPSEVARVPGSNRRMHPSFGKHNCTWGDEDVTKPSAFLALGPGEIPEVKAGSRSITIGGHRAVVIPRPRDELNSISSVTGQNIPSLPGCEVIVIHRPVQPAHLGWVETLSVSTAADRDPPTAQCPLSIQLATAAEKRLP